MAQGTVAGFLSLNMHEKRDSVDQQLQQAMQNVHTVRQQAAIQFNPMVDVGRRKMNQTFGVIFNHLKKINK